MRDPDLHKSTPDNMSISGRIHGEKQTRSRGKYERAWRS
jgi:hypothetical protein